MDCINSYEIYIINIHMEYNINFKNGTSLIWNLWLVCGKMINSSLESAVCKTPHIIKHSGFMAMI